MLPPLVLLACLKSVKNRDPPSRYLKNMIVPSSVDLKTFLSGGVNDANKELVLVKVTGDRSASVLVVPAESRGRGQVFGIQVGHEL